MKHSIFMLLAAAMIVACKPQENAAAQQASPGAANHANDLVQLETGGCRGYCPMYKLSFHRDGTLDYQGIRNVEKIGKQTVKLSAEEHSRLLKEVTRTDLWQYPAVIPSNIADAPTHTYTVFEGAKSHVVKGTAGIPAPILALESLMQDIAEAHGLPVKNGVNPNNPGVLKGSVIVKFKMDVNAKEFCDQFSDLKVRPITHVSEDNTWVIGFNPSELTEAQFTSLLKDMKGVISVEPNKQAKGQN